uniref:SFRICE_017514 n=1 Tax=Spodoptera frugiperda TaxID=7108 RepID=A0A2H1X1P5_SPOFR
MHNKLIVPVALGLSLVTVTAFVVYYVFKKDEEEEEVKKVKTARMNVIEVSVPKAIVAGLIGRGGSNIKDIEKISGAKVNVKEFSDKDHDICVIRGRTDATQIAETLVHEFINQQPVNIEDTMEVPSWACGRIIGSQGENINSISHRSGARIKISSSGDKTTVRKVMFLGTEEQIKVARDLIENCVS